MANRDDFTGEVGNRSKLELRYKDYHNTNVIYSWRIFHYSKLSHHVLYYQQFENTEVKCVFKVYKTQRALYLCLRSGTIKRKPSRFCIINENEKENENENENSLHATEALELADGVYAGDFANELYLEQDKCLKNDMLTVAFRYADRTSKVTEASLIETEPISNVDGFRNDLKRMYLAALNSDFLIHVGNYTFKAHRFVLAIRCKFFDELFIRNPEVVEYTLEAVPRIMHEVLLYVYSGELKKLEMPCMLEIFDMARMLRIEELTDRCIQFIAKNINRSNCRSISALAGKLDSVDLRNIVKKYRVKSKGKPDMTGVVYP